MKGGGGMFFLTSSWEFCQDQDACQEGNRDRFNAHLRRRWRTKAAGHTNIWNSCREERTTKEALRHVCKNSSF